MIHANILSWSIPFKYVLVTRLSPLQDRISWVIIQHLPVLYLVATGGDLSDFPSRCAVALLAMACMQTFYEIGYIQNDVVTVRVETAPTLRLPDNLREFGKNNLAKIVAARIAVGLSLFCATFVLALKSATTVNVWIFAAVLLITMTSFYLHNMVRSRWNVATYFLLACGRYASIPVLLAPEGQVGIYALLAVLMVPVVRTLEHGSKPKYGLVTLRRVMVPFERSRVVYYVTVSTTYLAAVLVNGWPALPGMVLLYLLIYRCAVLLAVLGGVVLPTKHRAYDD